MKFLITRIVGMGYDIIDLGRRNPPTLVMMIIFLLIGFFIITNNIFYSIFPAHYIQGIEAGIFFFLGGILGMTIVWKKELFLGVFTIRGLPAILYGSILMVISWGLLLWVLIF